MICPFCSKIIQEKLFDKSNIDNGFYYLCVDCRYVCSVTKYHIAETFIFRYANDDNEYTIKHIFYDSDNHIYYVKVIDKLSGCPTTLFKIKNQHIDCRYDPIYWKSLIMML